MAVMTMSSVRDYLADKRRATLTDIALHFDSRPEAVRPVLDRWQEKGRVEVLQGASACGKSSSACGCCTKPEAVYVWLDDTARRH
ncbi:MAG: FeoC-like transcriptional regulator [Caenispirillum sp.]|nr:FeoC-like transcriptional regulator [Caenispirillum sp.]